MKFEILPTKLLLRIRIWSFLILSYLNLAQNEKQITNIYWFQPKQERAKLETATRFYMLPAKISWKLHSRRFQLSQLSFNHSFVLVRSNNHFGPRRLRRASWSGEEKWRRRATATSEASASHERDARHQVTANTWPIAARWSYARNALSPMFVIRSGSSAMASGDKKNSRLRIRIPGVVFSKQFALCFLSFLLSRRWIILVIKIRLERGGYSVNYDRRITGARATSCGRQETRHALDNTREIPVLTRESLNPVSMREGILYSPFEFDEFEKRLSFPESNMQNEERFTGISKFVICLVAHESAIIMIPD